MKKIKNTKVSVFMNENVHAHIVDGNQKVGKGIYCINLLSGDEPLTLSNGLQLTNISGTCEGCCEHCKKSCYAIKNQKFRSTKNNLISWSENTLLAKQYTDQFFNDIQSFLNRSMVSAIRFHSFGEIPSFKYLLKMIELANNNPFVRFYTYTKRYEWIEQLLKEQDLPQNLVINISIWHKNYNNPYGLPEFIYDDHTDPSLANIPHCPAVDKNGNETGVTCATCKRCIFATKGQKTAVYEH